MCIRDSLNALHLNELKEDCLPLKRAYADVVQESPKSTEYGYCLLYTSRCV